MEIEKTERYICSECRRDYTREEDALNCEKEHKLKKQREDLTQFEIREEHLKLLKEMEVGWNDCEFGAPEIDPKRPYGNSDGVDDVARLIGYKKNKNNVEFDKEEAREYDEIEEYLNECEWTEKAHDYLYNLHKEMETVLQIVLSTLSFKKGKYKREDKYTSQWKEVDSANSSQP